MKAIITILALLLWLTSLVPAEAQYRAKIDQAWKRAQEQLQQEWCPPSQIKKTEPAKTWTPAPGPSRSLPDPKGL